MNLRVREDDVAYEPVERLRADSATGELWLPDQEVDAGHTVLHGDELAVRRIVGHTVRLDESTGPVVQEDQIGVGRLASFDLRQVVVDNLVVGFAVGPPEVDVLALQPLVQEWEIARNQRAKADPHANSSASSSASVLVNGCSSARSAGSRCFGRRGPTTTAVTHGWANNQEIASVAESTPRRSASSANRSSAVNVSGLRRCSYGSGRIAIRDPSCGGSSGLYFPVSQPPASGLYGV